MSAPLTLVVISRHDCHLCDAMVTDLRYHLHHRMGRGEVRIEVRNVDADPELTAHYTDRVPVLLIDGELVCEYRVDKAALLAYLSAKLPAAGPA